MDAVAVMTVSEFVRQLVRERAGTQSRWWVLSEREQLSRQTQRIEQAIGPTMHLWYESATPATFNIRCWMLDVRRSSF